MLVLTAAGEDRPVHDVSTLLSMVGQLCQLLDGSSSTVTDVEAWLIRLCKEQTVGWLSLMYSLIIITSSCNILYSMSVAYFEYFSLR